MTPPPPQLVDINGRMILLDRQLASGGEGAVFPLPNDSTLVAKVYHRPPTTQTVEKLTTMIRLANPKLLGLAAWPMGLLYHARTRQLAGFLMPRLNECQPIQHLYNPVQRLRSFPRAGWNFQVRAALNLAAAFEEVHKAGCLVGDVNQSNVQVSTQALVRLIDCDSFQVRMNGKDFLCEVGVAHYIPPELQGKSLRGLVRTENHDRFGLAVLIYQLLFVGRHPYAGVYRGAGDPSFEQLIAEFRFAQGPAAHTWGMAPPPHTPTFADIPPELGNLFRRAFERGSEAGSRPGPTEWLATLNRLEEAIMECAADPGHKYWRGTQSCVWCRLAAHGGPEYYFGVAGGVDTFVVDEVKLQKVLRRLEAVQQLDFPYNRAWYKSKTSAQPKPCPSHLDQMRNLYNERRRQLAKERHDQESQEGKEEESAKLNLKQLKDRLTRELAQQHHELDSELNIALDAVAIERKDRQTWTRVLVGATVFGLAMALFSCYNLVVGIFGCLVILVFGTWLAIYHYVGLQSPREQRVATIRQQKRQAHEDAKDDWRSAKEQAKREREKASEVRKTALLRLEEAVDAAAKAYQAELDTERDRRDKALGVAKQSLIAHENEWEQLANRHLRERNTIGQTIKGLVSQCRSLGGQYQAELQLLTARSEVAARLRHMRLHLLADADIPKIGAGRKQVLADNRIFSAADIEDYSIRDIKGFGDVLTSNLLAWKEQVLRQFRFDPATAVSPLEQRTITLKFRTGQQQFLAELDRQISHVESLALAFRTALQQLVPRLERAVAQFEQAEADLHMLHAKR